MDLFNYQEKVKQRKPEPGIHSYNHQIAKEVCEYLGKDTKADRKEFLIWVGVAYRIGGGALKAKLDYVKERGIKDSHYLLATTRIKKSPGDN